MTDSDEGADEPSTPSERLSDQTRRNLVIGGAIAAVGVLIAVGIAVAGGDGGSSDSVATSEPDRPGTTATTEPATTTTGPRGLAAEIANADGILGLTCEGGSASLTVTNPTTGQIRALRSVSTEPTPVCGIDEFDRYRFSQDFTKYAIEIESETDESRHVGYLDLETGETVDLTAQRDTVGDFEAAPQESGPQFAGNDEIVFDNGNTDTTEVVDITTNAARDLGPSTAVSYYTESAAARAAGEEPDPPVSAFARTRHVLTSTGSAYPLDYVVNPAGSFALQSGDDYGAVRVSGSQLLDAPLSSYDDFGHTESIGIVADAAIVGVATSAPCPVAELFDDIITQWVDDDTYVTPDMTLYTLDITATPGPDASLPVTCQELVPASDRENSDPIVTPDGSTVFFRSRQGTDLALFRASVVSPGAEPQRMFTLPQTDWVYLGWVGEEWCGGETVCELNNAAFAYAAP